MNYPNGIKKTITRNNNINYKNRGMTLEEDLNLTNAYYLENHIAYIYKKPTPIKVVKAVYENGNRIIKEAYYSEPSTTDYNGIYKGNYIDYEAKETQNKTSFPLANIHPHQIRHIRNIESENGICFLIIRFVLQDKTFLLPAKDFLEFLDNENRKSIPISYIERRGKIIKNKYIKRVDYLEIVDEIWRLK